MCDSQVVVLENQKESLLPQQNRSIDLNWVISNL